MTHRFPIERRYRGLRPDNREDDRAIPRHPPRLPGEAASRYDGASSSGAGPSLKAPIRSWQGSSGRQLRHVVPASSPREEERLSRGCRDDETGEREVGWRKFGFAFCTTDPAEVVADESVNTIFVATRHDTHARFATEALQRGHSVFVEKPLAVTKDELSAVEAAARAAPLNGQYLAVGFNRRFSAPLRQMAAFFADRRAPMFISYRVNAGRVPRDAWVHAEAQGGRMIGEGCHFIDTFAFLIGERPVQVMAAATWTENVETVGEDTATVTVSYADGSLATLAYVANGSDRVPKEHCEVSAEGKTAVLSNFKRLDLYTQGSATKRSYNGGKGHDEELAHFLDVVGGRAQPEFSVDRAGGDDARDIRRGRVDEDAYRRRALTCQMSEPTTSHDELDTKIMRSSAFAIVGFGGTNVLSLVTTIVLARLLTPADFGLVALTVSLLAFTHLVQESGLGAALVVHRGDLERAAASAALFTPVVGPGLYVVSFAAAPVLANLFREPELTNVFRVAALILPLRGLAIVPLALLEREMRLRPMTTIELAGGIAQAAVAIFFAVAGAGVWSLVAAQLATGVVQLHPRLEADPAPASRFVTATGRPSRADALRPPRRASRT